MAAADASSGMSHSVATQCCLLKVQRHEKADMAFQVLYYFTTNKKRQSHVRIKYYIKHNSD